ncbi:MAG: AMIN domain-containing protein [Gemmatimonadota bacterium]|nr:AMIN domain-containing protein [Gemmatimonadota bacterium]
MTSLFALWAGALLSLGGPVTEVTITPMATGTSVFIAVDGDVDYRDFTMEGPHRLVVDFMDSQHALPRENFTSVERGGIREVSTSQYSDDVVRVVFELDEKLGYSAVRTEGGLLITLDNRAGSFEPWSSAGAVSTRSVAELAQPTALAAQVPAQQEAERISMTWTAAPINDVLQAFAAFSGKSIVPGANVEGFVTATINDRPWDVALNSILSTQGLRAEEDEYGIIRVDNISDLNDREQIEQILTQAHRISFATATELQTAIEPLLSERGQITVGQGTNTLIVSDIERVQSSVSELLQQLDVETPQVSISAKIIFVDRTALDELGVTYELKDREGNQFNELSSGFADTDGDGVTDPVEQGTSVVSLGGSSIAALGNANARVVNPSIQFLTSLVIGRHTLINFIDALSSVNISDVHAEPQITTLDNQEAEIHVGELTPIRTIDAGGGAGGGQFPTAQVEQQETGIILRATPHVTNGNQILLDLEAERSAAELAESDAGFIFRTQRAQTRVLVRDGETVVIGGLTQSERNEVLTGIPVLMDLPFIGALFRVRRYQESQQDLIILVTPHIVQSSTN